MGSKVINSKYLKMHTLISRKSMQKVYEKRPFLTNSNKCNWGKDCCKAMSKSSVAVARRKDRLTIDIF